MAKVLPLSRRLDPHSNDESIALALAPDDAAAGERVDSTVVVGAVLTGTVERVEPYGVFVRLGPGQTGLVPNEELGLARGADQRKGVPVGS